MTKTNWQDPKTGEITSPHISGLQEAVGKLEESIGLESKFEEGILMSEVFVSNDDRCRIYQAAEGKRNWVASPVPIVKKNGSVITGDFEIDYGGGAIVFTTPISESDSLSVDATYTVSTDRLQEITETNPALYVFGNLMVSKLRGECVLYPKPCNPLGYVINQIILGGVY